jgi:acetyltransferase
MSALRAAAYAKPVVVMKAGRKAGRHARRADAFGRHRRQRRRLRRRAAPRRRGAGAQFTQLFSAAKCLASRFRPVGKRLAIVTNGGGPGVLAADWAEIGLGVAQLRRVAPGTDLGEGVIDPAKTPTATTTAPRWTPACKDRNADGVLLIYSPKAGSDPDAVAKAWPRSSRPHGKPVLGCWMGDASVRSARDLLKAALPASARPRRRWTPSTASPASTATSSCCSRRRRRCPTGRSPTPKARGC